MAYVVTDNCVRCKYTDCVTVCPVDCFHEGDLMLVIDPDECIDCGVCEPECPASAIAPAADVAPIWQDLNRDLAGQWPVIAEKKDPPADAERWQGVPDKFQTFLQP